MWVTYSFFHVHGRNLYSFPVSLLFDVHGHDYLLFVPLLSFFRCPRARLSLIRSPAPPFFMSTGTITLFLSIGTIHQHCVKTKKALGTFQALFLSTYYTSSFGNHKIMLVPLFTLLFTLITPLWASIKAFTIERPMPTPPVFRSRDLSPR